MLPFWVSLISLFLMFIGAFGLGWKTGYGEGLREGRKEFPKK